MLFTLKCLRYITAVLLLLGALFGLLGEIGAFAAVGSGKFLANGISHAHAFNTITLAILLALVLFFDFQLRLPAWGRRLIRILGLICLCLSLAGLVLIMLRHAENLDMWPFFVEQYIFQIGYITASLLLVTKTFEAKAKVSRNGGNANA